MQLPMPKNPETPRGHLVYQVLDDGERHIAFRVEPEELEAVRAGRVVGLFLPPSVPLWLIHELVRHTVDDGLCFVVRPFDEAPASEQETAKVDEFLVGHVQLSDGRFVPTPLSEVPAAEADTAPENR